MTTQNPCGIKRFSFLEFSGPEPTLLHQQFKRLCFSKTYLHQALPISLYHQDQILFIINETLDTQAHRHAQLHGAGACAMGFEVEDAEKAFTYALKHGATSHEEKSALHGVPAIEAIGGSVIYFTDEHLQPFSSQLNRTHEDHPTAGLNFIDHLTHNVYRGNMDKWADFYKDLFNFQQIRYFDISGQKTGLVSRALASPNGQIKIPLNESKDEVSQIEEFLKAYQGEGIQHIALHTSQIYKTVTKLRAQHIQFLDVPEAYYEMVQTRLPWHQESLDDLKRLSILIDGEPTPEAGLLLQIFTENTFGPVFFEIIQRKGNEGFGEGNFKALFEAIERDQLKRGTLK